MNQRLRLDAQAIWQAGVAAANATLLVRQAVRVAGHELFVSDDSVDLNAVRRIVVVGAGKACAAMAAGLEAALGPQIVAGKLTGWVNVPADTLRPLGAIRLHAARPTHVNEPTPEGVAGALEIMRLVGSLGTDDLCILLLSGGGSALLPLPIDGITLADKVAVTRLLSAVGAPIEELNLVRAQLSQIKGGGLARACRAGRMIGLVVSDVLGDSLATIASGPAVPASGSSADATAILDRYGAREADISPRVFAALSATPKVATPVTCQVSQHVIGNNVLAVDAAGVEAMQRGYSHAMVSAPRSEGAAEDIGVHLARMAQSMRAGGPNCLISGGEPTVKLVPPEARGLGGRNQQLVLAAAKELRAAKANGVCILSAGTDGEDGPTDAAGAFVDAEILSAATRRGLDPSDYLARNDAYHWFEPLGALVKSGPTDTNVCDLRVVLVDRSA